MTFPRSVRLLKHADFERVYDKGRRHFSANMTLFYLFRESGEGIRVGFTVSRALGDAVERNRMKRRLREAVRLTRLGMIVQADIVINPKRSLLKADFANVVKEVSRGFEVVELKSKNFTGRATSDPSPVRKPI